jgi:hypothetical protein
MTSNGEPARVGLPPDTMPFRHRVGALPTSAAGAASPSYALVSAFGNGIVSGGGGQQVRQTMPAIYAKQQKAAPTRAGSRQQSLYQR